MKPRFFLTLSLLIALLAACAPNVSTPPVEQPIIVVPSVTRNSQPDAAFIPTATPLIVSASTQALAPAALPIATSRGDALEATDPSTVSLASGGLHFVEFFRFT